MLQQTTGGVTSQEVAEWAQLVDKYGFSLILSIVLLIIVLTFLYWLMTGKIVPKLYLDRSEEDRDRMQAIMEEERKESLSDIKELLGRLKKDEDMSRGG
ncbi:hypothetical protein BK126_04375 [Paenibacillus sp. FSL H7-0326]|uniref:hypothetical protein n=1 Tax=Paenibacillus sp. FSL H7-0326 TaxID=1921144 RepID=UPI00096D98AD|nr:hypothetical protein [Paenibacillus sp. FSL H7-0326]OMC71338.1 hypothetical protein BK126_04375 [Paenibacillus sp. FSL H7-0326]